MWSVILAILLTIVSVLLMFIILLQRGRGGGLAGALGGMGGQSAFGTKAGDVFTKITVGMALAWVVLAGVTGMAMHYDSTGRFRGASNAPSSVSKPAGDAEADGEAGKKSGRLIIPPGNGKAPGDGAAVADAAAAGGDTPADTNDKSSND